ncbi:MAG: histidinol-phosphate transaminase, partial [Chloroflexi bacterium]
GVLVRHYNKPGLQNCIRISVGRPEQTDRLLEVLYSL